MSKSFKVFLLVVIFLSADVHGRPFFQKRGSGRPAESRTYFRPRKVSNFDEKSEEVATPASSLAPRDATPDWMDWLLNDMNLKKYLPRSTQAPEPTTSKPVVYQETPQTGPRPTESWQPTSTVCHGPLPVCRPGVSADQFDLLMHKVDNVLNKYEDTLTKAVQGKSSAAPENEKPHETTKSKEWVDVKFGPGSSKEKPASRQKVYPETRTKPKTTTTRRPSTTTKPKKTTLKTTTLAPATTTDMFSPVGFNKMASFKKGFLMCPCTHSPEDPCKGGTEEALPLTCLLYKHKKLDNGHLFECACSEPGQGVVTIGQPGTASQGTAVNATTVAPTPVTTLTTTLTPTTTTTTMTTTTTTPTSTTLLSTTSTATTTTPKPTTTTGTTSTTTTTPKPITTTTAKATSTIAPSTTTSAPQNPGMNPLDANQPQPVPKPPSMEPSGGGMPFPSTEGVGETGGDPGIIPPRPAPVADLGQVGAVPPPQQPAQPEQTGALQQPGPAVFDPQQGYYPSQGVPLPGQGVQAQQPAFGAHPGIDSGLQQTGPGLQAHDPNTGFSNGRVPTFHQQGNAIDFVTPNQAMADVNSHDQWQQHGLPGKGPGLQPAGFNGAAGLDQVLPQQYQNFPPSGKSRREVDRHASWIDEAPQDEVFQVNLPLPLIARTTEKPLTSDEIKRRVFLRMGRG